MQWILMILGVVLAVVAVFALQNPAVVTVRFLNFEADASVLVVILVAFAAGVFAGILALLPSSIRKSGRMRKMGSELRSLEKQRLKETGSAADSPSPPLGGNVPPPDTEDSRSSGVAATSPFADAPPDRSVDPAPSATHRPLP
ncbi:MAG: LapA family protein [Thermoleophilia bacterium]